MTGTRVTITLPHLCEDVIEATISRWLAAPGDHVDADEPLLEVATDKVDTEVPLNRPDFHGGARPHAKLQPGGVLHLRSEHLPRWSAHMGVEIVAVAPGPVTSTLG